MLRIQGVCCEPKHGLFILNVFKNFSSFWQGNHDDVAVLLWRNTQNSKKWWRSPFSSFTDIASKTIGVSYYIYPGIIGHAGTESHQSCSTFVLRSVSGDVISRKRRQIDTNLVSSHLSKSYLCKAYFKSFPEKPLPTSKFKRRGKGYIQLLDIPFWLNHWTLNLADILCSVHSAKSHLISF